MHKTKQKPPCSVFNYILWLPKDRKEESGYERKLLVYTLQAIGGYYLV